jgi:KaiC/GvpD/RAD55 family RecA-like ATPase
MKVVTANGKQKVVMNRKEWESIGKTAGWRNEDVGELTEEQKAAVHSATAAIRSVLEQIELECSNTQTSLYSVARKVDEVAQNLSVIRGTMERVDIRDAGTTV